MTAALTEFRFVGTHVDNLHDGRPLEPGLFYKLDNQTVEHPETARLISESLLLEVPAKTKEKA